MTNPPGEGTPPEGPDEQRPAEQPEASRPGEYQPGYWEQQAQQQGQQGQPPYQQEPYQQPWQSYPQAGYQTQYAPDHPRATTSLVLGILGVVLCQLVAPFAWVIGKRTLDEIDASQGTVGGRGAAQAGYILGIVGSVLLGLGLIFIVIWVVFAVAIVGSGMNGNF